MAAEKITIKPVSKKIERELHQTKVIVRHLPPRFTEEKFLELVGPLASHNYFYFAVGDPKLGKFGYSRAYINFEADEDIIAFRDKFDGCSVTDERGNAYRMIVEFAPFQRCLRKKKKTDAKCGTIEDTPEYKEFLVEYDAEPEQLPALDPTVYAVKDISTDQVQETPLTKYLKNMQEKKMKHLYKPKSIKTNELKKERMSKSEKSKKGSDIVVPQKRSSKSDDKLPGKGTEDKEGRTDSSSKRKHRYDDEATVRIISKSRSDTRSNSTSSRASAKDSRSDPLLANGSVYQQPTVVNGSPTKKTTNPIEKSGERYSTEGRKQRKSRPDQQFYSPRNRGSETNDKDSSYSRGDTRYRNDYDYHDGEKKEGRYSRYSGKPSRYQQEGRRHSNRDYT